MSSEGRAGESQRDRQREGGRGEGAMVGRREGGREGGRGSITLSVTRKSDSEAASMTRITPLHGSAEYHFIAITYGNTSHTLESLLPVTASDSGEPRRQPCSSAHRPGVATGRLGVATGRWRPHITNSSLLINTRPAKLGAARAGLPDPSHDPTRITAIRVMIGGPASRQPRAGSHLPAGRDSVPDSDRARDWERPGHASGPTRPDSDDLPHPQQQAPAPAPVFEHWPNSAV